MLPFAVESLRSTNRTAMRYVNVKTETIFKENRFIRRIFGRLLLCLTWIRPAHMFKRQKLRISIEADVVEVVASGDYFLTREPSREKSCFSCFLFLPGFSCLAGWPQVIGHELLA
jgi:hypothetical protein